MKHDKEFIEKIATQVESEYQMSGLACGIYLDFATDVAIRYVNAMLPQDNDTKSVCTCESPNVTQNIIGKYCMDCKKYLK